MRIVPVDPATGSDAELAAVQVARAAAAAVDRPLDPPPLLADLVDRFRDVRPDRRTVSGEASGRPRMCSIATAPLSCSRRTTSS